LSWGREREEDTDVHKEPPPSAWQMSHQLCCSPRALTQNHHVKAKPESDCTPAPEENLHAISSKPQAPESFTGKKPAG